MVDHLDRRQFLGMTGALAILLALEGCGANSPSSTPSARASDPSNPPSAQSTPTTQPTLTHSGPREVLLFHHAQGLTAGVEAFADQLRAAGHVVYTPDLLDGRTFDTVEDGVVYAEEVGFDEVLERGVRAAQTLPSDLVYIGFSLGVISAQMLAQTRAGARGALLISACLPVREYSTAWPDGVPVQVHAMDADPWFVDGGDLEAAGSRQRRGSRRAGALFG